MIKRWELVITERKREGRRLFGKSCVWKTSKYNYDYLLGLTIENQVSGDIERVAPRLKFILPWNIALQVTQRGKCSDTFHNGMRLNKHVSIRQWFCFLVHIHMF